MEMQPISIDTLASKYALGTESLSDVYDRVAAALAQAEKDPERWQPVFREAFDNGLLMAGRIMSGAGSGVDVTLLNCFVEPVGDSMAEIMNALADAAETMRRGGGVGYSFSRIRPHGAKVKGTGSVASGPLSYMSLFDAMCDTVSSKGSRRGAQMGVLSVDHPDIEAFVDAKAKPFQEKPYQNFNLSVGIKAGFMEAVEQDHEWSLVHEAEPSQALIDSGAYRRDDGLWVYRSISARGLWQKIMRATYDYADPGVLFLDRMNAENNLAYCETIEATNPCGEQPLPPFGCCCLGPVNLAKLVKQPFTDDAQFDYAQLASLVRVAVRMLDNVLDLSYWPLEAQRQEAMQKRRVGLGYTGLGDALLMLGLRYGGDAARDFTAHVTRCLRDEAYSASIDLAKEKGAFPLLDKERYLSSGFARRLPVEIQAEIRQHGIRNSHLLSIAPTGTVSLAFGDNCSSGIEPVFTWHGQRRVRQANGPVRIYPVYNHAYRLFKHLQGWDALPDEEVVGRLPGYWVTAEQVDPFDHLAMVAAAAPYIDTAISKTINVGHDYPFERFRDLYLEAWKGGLKGVTTFRANAAVEGVLLKASEPPPASADLDESDPDRRIRLKSVPELTLASLRWRKRPRPVNGNPAWVYMIEHPHGSSFAVFIGHIQNGKSYPFEVWVNGAEQPRGLGALAKSLSMDMRSNDRGYLRAKLASLMKTASDEAFDMPFPPTGEIRRMPSLVAAFAAVVEHRCAELGAFEDGGKTPVLDALMSRKEPKAGPDGTLSWTVDVNNATTGDDFVLGVKELDLPDGTRRPYSIWLAGDYPRVLDGLCKSLSFDMRVLDPAWVGGKLRQLLDYAEPRGEFWAKAPRADGQQLYSSTVAYLARLLIHRYAMLGILDEEGYPMQNLGAVDIDGDEDSNVVPLRAAGAMEVRQYAGKRCTECGNYSMIKRDGCDYCSACGATGSCG